MSAFSFAKQAFGREKPHSSTTDWIDILTSSTIEEEAYDGQDPFLCHFFLLKQAMFDLQDTRIS